MDPAERLEKKWLWDGEAIKPESNRSSESQTTWIQSDGFECNKFGIQISRLSIQ